MRSFISTLFISVLFPTTAFAALPNCKLFLQSVAQGTSSQKLKKFLDATWKYKMTEYPEWATFVGYPGQDDRWTDQSLEAIARRENEVKCQLQAVKKIPRKGLAEEERVTLELSIRELEQSVEGQKFPGEYLVLDHMSGIQIDLADLLIAMPRAKVSDYENILKRLEKLPVVEGQLETLLREGLKRKVTPVRLFLQKVPRQFDAILTEKVEDSPLYAPFKEMKSMIPAEEQTRLKAKAAEVLQAKVYPALKKLRDYLVKEYIPNSRESISWSEMPDGKAWYAFLVKSHTTTNKTPDELHELGLSEVARLKAEMEKVIAQVKYKGDIKSFNSFLLTDSQFYFTDARELMRSYRDIAKQIDPELPRLFGRLPRLTYGVREMPAYKAKEAPTAYYQPGSPAGGRPGYFEANTYDLKARPKWGMEALTLHEAVPGHHLQIALAQETETIPEFRKHGGTTAFVEGWGLYAESLGEDIGLYKDPSSKYGQLAYEMWRAIRLVVDTGMHAKGWSREKALQYYMDLMPKTQLESEVEIDRYITWPGQALAYKVGQLKFLELRAKARKTLGDAFDIRAFHDEVLRHGAVPMDVLEKLFDEWLEKRKNCPL
jgi:uncharacterized protein (DUF885 family)